MTHDFENRNFFIFVGFALLTFWFSEEKHSHDKESLDTLLVFSIRSLSVLQPVELFATNLTSVSQIVFVFSGWYEDFWGFGCQD